MAANTTPKAAVDIHGPQDVSSATPLVSCDGEVPPAAHESTLSSLDGTEVPIVAQEVEVESMEVGDGPVLALPVVLPSTPLSPTLEGDIGPARPLSIDEAMEHGPELAPVANSEESSKKQGASLSSVPPNSRSRKGNRKSKKSKKGTTSSSRKGAASSPSSPQPSTDRPGQSEEKVSSEAVRDSPESPLTSQSPSPDPELASGNSSPAEDGSEFPSSAAAQGKGSLSPGGGLPPFGTVVVKKEPMGTPGKAPPSSPLNQNAPMETEEPSTGSVCEDKDALKEFLAKAPNNPPPPLPRFHLPTLTMSQDVSPEERHQADLLFARSALLDYHEEHKGRLGKEKLQMLQTAIIATKNQQDGAASHVSKMLLVLGSHSVLPLAERIYDSSLKIQSFLKAPILAQRKKQILEARRRLFIALNENGFASAYEGSYESRIDNALALSGLEEEEKVNAFFADALRSTGRHEDADFALFFDPIKQEKGVDNDEDKKILAPSVLRSAPAGLRFFIKRVKGTSYLVPIPSQKQRPVQEYTELQRERMAEARSVVTRGASCLKGIPHGPLKPLREIAIHEAMCSDEVKYPTTCHLVIAQGLRAFNQSSLTTMAKKLESWYSTERPSSYAEAASVRKPKCISDRSSPPVNEKTLRSSRQDSRLPEEVSKTHRQLWDERTFNLPRWIVYDPNLVWARNSRTRRKQKVQIIRNSLVRCSDATERAAWHAWCEGTGPRPVSVAKESSASPQTSLRHPPVANPRSSPASHPSYNERKNPKDGGGTSVSPKESPTFRSPLERRRKSPPPLSVKRKGRIDEDDFRPPSDRRNRGSNKRTADFDGPQPFKMPRPCPQFLAALKEEKKRRSLGQIQDPGASRSTGRYVGYGLDGLRYKGRFSLDKFHLSLYIAKDKELALGCTRRWIKLQSFREKASSAHSLTIAASAAHPLSPLYCHRSGFQVCSRKVHSLLQGLTIHILRFQLLLNKGQRHQIDAAEIAATETMDPQELLKILREATPIGLFPPDYLMAAFWRTGKVCEAVVDMYHSVLHPARQDPSVLVVASELAERCRHDPKVTVHLDIGDDAQVVKPFLGTEALMGGDLWGLTVVEAMRRHQSRRRPVGP